MALCKFSVSMSYSRVSEQAERPFTLNPQKKTHLRNEPRRVYKNS